MSRLVVLTQTYHHGPTTDKPVMAETRASHPTIDEAAYIRPMKANAEWHKLDFGWVESPSLIVIKAKNAVVEMSFGGEWVHAIVLAKDEARFTPMREVFVRGGEYTIYAFPALK